jgi:hypothetical protein
VWHACSEGKGVAKCPGERDIRRGMFEEEKEKEKE